MWSGIYLISDIRHRLSQCSTAVEGQTD